MYLFNKKGTWSKQLFLPSKNQEKNYKNSEKKIKPDSKGEIECRKVMEKIFNAPFPKDRPNILRNPVTENFNMELDCYNSELKIACEYNGIQHYKFTPFFHKSKEAFYNQKYRDELKRRICKENGIFLIEVPYAIKIENIETFIKDRLNNRK